MSMEEAMGEYRKLTRRAYRLLQGTWGYTPLGLEGTKIKDDHKHPAPPGPGHFQGMSPGVALSSLFDPDYQTRIRGYACFKDELDALQFRLTLDTSSIQVRMWPEKLRFTVHEVIEDES